MMAAKATGYHGGGEKWAEFKIYLEKDWLGDCDAECERNRRIKHGSKIFGLSNWKNDQYNQCIRNLGVVSFTSLLSFLNFS